MSLSVWLEGACATDFGRFVVTLMARIGGSGAFESRDTSLLHMLFTQSTSAQREEPETWLLRGCAGQIPGKVQRLLELSPRAKVLLDATVSSIAEDQEEPQRGVTVSSSAGDFRASRAVVAMPPCTADQIDFAPRSLLTGRRWAPARRWAS